MGAVQPVDVVPDALHGFPRGSRGGGTRRGYRGACAEASREPGDVRSRWNRRHNLHFRGLDRYSHVVIDQSIKTQRSFAFLSSISCVEIPKMIIKKRKQRSFLVVEYELECYVAT